MPTKDSVVRGVRISNGTIARIMERANRKGWTFNRWMNWAISLGHGATALYEATK